MHLAKKIKEKITSEKPIQVENISQLEEEFLNRRKEKLEEIDKDTEEFKEKVTRALEELETDLNKIEGYSDQKNRAVIEDVISNLVKDRKQMIEKFTINNPQKLHQDLENFLEEFRSMTKKEAAVLEEANLDNHFSLSLGKIENILEELDRFLENKYTTKLRYQKIQEKIRERKQKKKKLAKLNQDWEEVDIAEAKSKIEQKEEEISKLEESNLKQEKEELKSRLEEGKEQERKAKNKIGKAGSKMERGLKKMIYEGEIGKLSQEGSEVLRNIRDGETEQLLTYDPEVVEKASEEAQKSADREALDENTVNKLEDGADYFEDFTHLKEQIKTARTQIKNAKKELEEHTYSEKRKSLDKELESLRQNLRDQKGKKDRLKQERKEVKEEFNKKKNQVIEITGEEFQTSINVEN